MDVNLLPSVIAGRDDESDDGEGTAHPHGYSKWSGPRKRIYGTSASAARPKETPAVHHGAKQEPATLFIVTVVHRLYSQPD